MVLNNDLPLFRERLTESARKYAALETGAHPGVKTLEFKTTDLVLRDKRWEFEGIATSDAVDEDEEVVLPDGVSWKPLEAYKTIYVDHQYGIRNAVAKLRYITRHKARGVNGWKMRAVLLPEDYSPEVAMVRTVIEHDMGGLSFGFIPEERGAPTADEKRIYPKARSMVRKSRAFEVSVTLMRCNMDCETGRLTMTDGGKAAGIRDLVTKGLLPASYARAFDPPRTVVVVPSRTVVVVPSNN